MKEKETKLDFDVSSIFGGFEPLSSLTTEEEPKDTPPAKIEEEQEDSPNEGEDNEPNSASAEDDGEDDVPKHAKLSNVDKDDDDQSDEEIEISYKGIASYLAEQGLVDFEDAEDMEDSPEILSNIIFDTAKNMVEEYKESLPEEGKLFLEYLEKGGDPSKFLSTLEAPVDVTDLDLTDETNQKKVLREYLKIQEYSNDEIEEEIKDYEDALILAKKAKTAASKLKQIYDKQAEQLVKEQEKRNNDNIKKQQEHINKVVDTIQTSKEFANIPLTEKDKKDFEKYILVRDKEGLTQYEKDIKENPIKTQLELAYLKFKKFDYSKVAKTVKTEEAKRIRNILKTKDNSLKGNSKNFSNSKSDLSAFKSFLK